MQRLLGRVSLVLCLGLLGGGTAVAQQQDTITGPTDPPAWAPRTPTRPPGRDTTRDTPRDTTRDTTRDTPPTRDTPGGGSFAVGRPEDDPGTTTTPTQPNPPIRTTDRPYRATSLWEHNGSVVALVLDGDTRRFYYEEPRQGLAELGVRPTTLLFEGREEGLTLTGRAYVFQANCPPLAYQVSGQIEASRIVLRGQAPRRNDRCEQIETRADTLTFNYQRAVPRTPQR